FTLTGNVGATPVGITSAGFGGPFFSNGLILKFPDVAATVRALAQRGKLRSTNSPVTYTKTAMPVQIRSVTQQTIFLQTAATAKSTRLNSSHVSISYAVFCLKKKIKPL